MTPLTKKIRARPNLAYELAFMALAVAFALGILTVVLHYNDRAHIGEVAAQEATDNKAQLARIRDALCGPADKPGLLPTLAGVPFTPQTTQLGRTLVYGAQRAAAIVQCPPPIRRP